DSLAVLPHAEITVKVVAEDALYAVRSVYLEYRCKRDDPPRKLFLYEHRSAGAVIPALLSAMTLSPMPISGPPLRLRWQRLEIVQRLSLKQLKHLDGSSLKEGDIVTLQACADDFDDIAVDKQPGRSHEVELRIVSAGTLDTLLNQAQAQLQQALVRLREQQREARSKVEPTEKQWRQKGSLSPEDVDKLLQAEQLQQQIRGRIGSNQEGLRAEVAKILQTLRDNQLRRSDTHERMETVAAEL